MAMGFSLTAAIAFVQILESQNHKTFRQTINKMPESFLFSMMERVPGDMLWAHFGPPGTPRKGAFNSAKGHFGQHFIERAQCSITRVLWLFPANISRPQQFQRVDIFFNIFQVKLHIAFKYVH